MDDINELRRLAEAATPGPWRISGFEIWANGNSRVVMGGDDFSLAHVGERSLKENEADAAYIAACSPDVILALLAALGERDVGIKPLDFSNFDGPRLNKEWSPDNQDLIYTALNWLDGEGDADEDCGQQLVERLLAAWRSALVPSSSAEIHQLADRIDDLMAEFGEQSLPMIGEAIGRWRQAPATPSALLSDLSTLRDRVAELEGFLGEVQGVCLGVAMSGSDHPNPDGALMGLFEKAQALALSQGDQP